MDFFNSNRHQQSTTTKKFNVQEAFTNLRDHCSAFLQQQHHHHHHLVLNISTLKTQLESTLSNIQHHAKHALDPSSSSSSSGFSSGNTKNPVWSRIAAKNDDIHSSSSRTSTNNLAMSTEAIEERLAGVPVYALSNSSQEFVLLSGVRTGKSLALFCFKEEDADALLQQMKSMDPAMRRGSKVVAVALNKVFQLKVGGVAFRLIPEASQIKNAIRVRQKSGQLDKDFMGIPVFQSRSLLLKSQDKRYRPVFFRKEDLEKSLLRASRQQNVLNPAFRELEIQVAVLEDIIEGMRDGTTSNWDDVVFIPPGFDVSTDASSAGGSSSNSNS